MPAGCGYEGWQFKIREAQKEKIRKIKEYLYEVKIFFGEGMIPGKNTTVKELEAQVDAKIAPWLEYGAKYW